MTCTIRFALVALAFCFTADCHPRLFTTPTGVELARKRAATEAWAKAAVEELRASASALERQPLPKFETQWWEEARKKRWQDIYPEVNLHTMSAIAGPMLKLPDAAMAYAVTGERRYAELVRRVLLHYSRYEFFAKHPDVGLNWSIWSMAGLRAYDLVHDTLSETDRAAVDDFFKRAAEAILQNDKDWIRENYGGAFNNHYAHHKLYLGSYGLFYDRPDLVDYAVNGEEGFRELIEYAHRDDGLWLEASLNYHFTGVLPIAEFASELENAGNRLNLWQERFANGCTLCSFFSGPVETLFPDGTLPTIGDTYGRRASLKSMPAYVDVFAACPDARIGWVAQAAKKTARALFLKRLPDSQYVPPAMRTRLWPEHGFVALRSEEGVDYWKGNGFSVFLTYDADNIHGHRDKLSFMAFGRGAHIAVDPEAVASAPHAFSARVQNELNRHTLCHNTLLVDGKAHGPVHERLTVEKYIDHGDVKLVTVSDRRGLIYPGVRLMRTVAVASDSIVDVFQAASAGEHAYEYLFHTPGALSAPGFQPATLEDAVPWNWLRSARERRVDTDWSISARQGDLETRLIMAGHPGTRVTVCDFPRNDAFEAPGIPMLAARRKAASAVFAAVIEAGRGVMPETRVSIEQGRHGYLRVAVNRAGAKREILVEALR